MKRLDPNEGEGKEILKIVHGSFLKELKTEEKVQDAMARLAAVVKEPGAKLLHIDDCVFLILVRGKTLVEVHTMAIKEDSLALAKSFVKLTKYLKAIGVKLAYTYTNDPKYEIVAKRTKLPFRKQNLQLEDGSQYTAYSVVL